MAKFTVEQAAEHAQKLMQAFNDGFQWSDVLTIIPQAMEIVATVSDATGEEREESAVMILDYIIDNTDIPWLPDSLVDPILKNGVRHVVPMLAKAARGEYKLGE